MDPITWVTVLNVVKKYWWVIPILLVACYIWFLRADISSKDKTIDQQKQTIIAQAAQIADFKSKIASQNAAVDMMVKKGIEQTTALNKAIDKANAIRPSTQETIREIYSDRTQDIRNLLFNAKRD